MSSSQITALLDLLQDESETVRAAVAARFRELGETGLVALEGARRSEDAHLRARARILLDEIRTDYRTEQLSALLSGDTFDLETSCTLLAQVENPDLPPDRISKELDRLADLVSEELPTRASSHERADTLGAVLHGREGFTGNAEEYHEPKNSLLDHVLQRRLGIPISLSAVYLLVGRRAGLTLHGVGMPWHFLVQLDMDDKAWILDPFGGGRILTRQACRAMLTGLRHSWKDEYLDPIDDRHMVQRMMSNLIRIYHRTEDAARLNRLYRFVNDIQDAQP